MILTPSSKMGVIIDSSERSMFKADIGLLEGKISEVGDLKGRNAERVIDVKNLFVSPGFIDCHARACPCSFYGRF